MRSAVPDVAAGFSDLVAIIPARGGSQRIPRKNIKVFNGKPMIEWPILAALESKVFSRVIVSTEDSEIAKVASQAGAEIPFLRPNDLGGNDVGAASVVLHAIETLTLGPSVAVMNIYPTSPLTPNLFRSAVEDFSIDMSRFLISVGRYRTPVERALTLSAGLMSHQQKSSMHVRSQDLPDSYFDAGKFHIATARVWRRSETMMADPFVPFFLPAWATVDIDEPDDWQIAEALHKAFVLERSQ